MAAPPISGATRLVQGYYWLTPVFLFASWRWGIDVRVPFLEAIPGAQFSYYTLICACAGIVFWRPNLTAIVGRTETTISAATLVITTWTAYFTMIDEAASSAATFTNPFTPESVASLALSASVFIASLLSQDASLRASDRAVPG